MAPGVPSATNSAEYSGCSCECQVQCRPGHFYTTARCKTPVRQHGAVHDVSKNDFNAFFAQLFDISFLMLNLRFIYLPVSTYEGRIIYK